MARSTIMRYELYSSILVMVGLSSCLIDYCEPLTKPKSIWKCCPGLDFGRYMSSRFGSSLSEVGGDEVDLCLTVLRTLRVCF